MMKKFFSIVLTFILSVSIPSGVDVSAANTGTIDVFSSMEFNGNRYYYFDYSLSWSEAEQYCESIGGHLVCINSQEEQNMLIELTVNATKKNAWIGAHAVDGEYCWTSGEAFTYENWAPGEPNNVFNTQFTAMMYLKNSSYDTGLWNDENENGRNWTGYYLSDFGFICEIGTIEQPTEEETTKDIEQPTEEETTKEYTGTNDYGYQWSMENMPLSINVHYFTTMYGKYQGMKLYEKNERIGEKGLCYGFALSSATLELGSIKVNDLFYANQLFDVKNLYEMAKNNFIIHQPIDLIIYSHLYQLSYDASSQSKKNHSIKNLIKELSEGNTNILVYVENKAHVVITRGLRQISETSWIIDVYDSNWPGELNKIYVTKQGNDYGYLFDPWNGHNQEGESSGYFGTTDLTYIHVDGNYLKTLMEGKTIDKIDNFFQFLLTANSDMTDRCNKELYDVNGNTNTNIEKESSDTNSKLYWINGDGEDILVRGAKEISLTGAKSTCEVSLSNDSDITFATDNEEIKSALFKDNADATILFEKEIDGKNVSFNIVGKLDKDAIFISKEEGVVLKNFDNTIVEIKSDGNVIGKQTIDEENVEISIAGDNVTVSKEDEFEKTDINISECSIKINEIAYISNGKPIIPSYVIMNINGVQLKEGIDYIASYTNNINPGIGNIIIKGIGTYTGTLQTTFTIVKADNETTKQPTIVALKKPTKVKGVTAKNSKKRAVVVKFKKSKNAKKYKIQISTDKNFKKKVKTKTVKKLTWTFKKLKKGKTYYVRVAALNGKKQGAWSAKKKVKIKK